MKETINYLLNSDLTVIYSMVEMFNLEQLHAMLENEYLMRDQVKEEAESEEELKAANAILDKMYNPARERIAKLSK